LKWPASEIKISNACSKLVALALGKEPENLTGIKYAAMTVGIVLAAYRDRWPDSLKNISMQLASMARTRTISGVGSKVSGNLWQTTGDIRNLWESMDKIGFSQLSIASYNRSGYWNDPDMLEINNGR
jgi:hypothetical protein